MPFPERKGAGCLWKGSGWWACREGLAAGAGPCSAGGVAGALCPGQAAVVAELDQKWSLRAKTALSRIFTIMMRIVSRKNVIGEDLII